MIVMMIGIMMKVMIVKHDDGVGDGGICAGNDDGDNDEGDDCDAEKDADDEEETCSNDDGAGHGDDCVVIMTAIPSANRSLRLRAMVFEDLEDSTNFLPSTGKAWRPS